MSYLISFGLGFLTCVLCAYLFLPKYLADKLQESLQEKLTEEQWCLLNKWLE